MKLTRKDFVPKDSDCQLCADNLNRRGTIKKGSAWIYQQNGREFIVGPSCREKISNWRDTLPDLTKGTIELTEAGAVGVGGGGGGSTTAQTELSSASETYLILRFRHLDGFLGAKSIDWQKEIWEQFEQTGALSRLDRKRIEGFLRTVSGRRFSLEHLAGVYAAKYWIEQFIKTEPSSEYMESVFRQLKKSSWLSAEQVRGVNNWFQNTEIMHRLRDEPFSWRKPK